MAAESAAGLPVYSIAPMLSVRGGAQAVKFYQAAFGATEVPGGSRSSGRFQQLPLGRCHNCHRCES